MRASVLCTGAPLFVWSSSRWAASARTAQLLTSRREHEVAGQPRSFATAAAQQQPLVVKEKKPRKATTKSVAPPRTIQAVSTSQAPAAIGPYSQAVVATGPFLFVSGCIGLHPQTMEFAGGDVSAQTEQVMQNVGAILKAGGSSFADVVKCTILLTDMKHFAAVNEVYAKCTPPARATFATNGLPKGALVEIECTASVAHQPQEKTKKKKRTTASQKAAASSKASA